MTADASCLIRATSCLKGAFSTFSGSDKAGIIPHLKGMQLKQNPTLSDTLLPWFIESIKKTTFQDEMLAWQDLVLSYVPELTQQAVLDQVAAATWACVPSMRCWCFVAQRGRE